MSQPVDIHAFRLGFDQCYVIRGEGVVVIDAGEPGKERQFGDGLQAAGIAPEEVKLIVLTHGHWDHIGSAGAIRSVTHAPLAMHRSEIDWLENSRTIMPPGVTAWGRLVAALSELIRPFIRIPAVRVDIPIDDDGLSLEEYGVPGRVYHTPGHSPGSVSVLLDTGDAFVGDLAMNRLPLRLSPGLPIFADDISLVVRSWKLLLERGARTVYPAHGKPFPASIMEKAIRSVA